MYELATGVGVILFLATFVLPSQPLTASFWILGIACILIGSYASFTIKAMFSVPFLLFMITGIIFMFT